MSDEAEIKLIERKAWMVGWERGVKFGRVGGRNAYRVRLRKMIRERGIRATITHLLERPRKRARR